MNDREVTRAIAVMLGAFNTVFPVSGVTVDNALEHPSVKILQAAQVRMAAEVVASRACSQAAKSGVEWAKAVSAEMEKFCELVVEVIKTATAEAALMRTGNDKKNS